MKLIKQLADLPYKERSRLLSLEERSFKRDLNRVYRYQMGAGSREDGHRLLVLLSERTRGNEHNM